MTVSQTADNAHANGNGYGNSNGFSDRTPFNKPIDDVRPMKVICIGAGFSGILTGVRFPQRVKNLDLTIYEKNEDIGGTWYENRYPGIACDVPCHSYQYTFASNSQWSHFYAPGAEIEQYLKNVAKRYDVMRYVKLKHQFGGATWNVEKGKWEVQVTNLSTGETFIDEADVLISATGMLNRWSWPDIPGLQDFKGELLHSANWKNWDLTFDPKGKNVAVIGGGSTGIQIMPQMQHSAARVDHYMKGKQWISPVGVGGKEAARRGVNGNFKYGAEELKSFLENPEAYNEYRHRIEGNMNEAQLITFTGTEAQKEFWALSKDSMATKLATKPKIYDSLTPQWPPGCRRLTPGPGYLESLVQDNVDFIGCGIQKVVDNGIEAKDGKLRKVDAIICATGYDTSLTQKVDVIGFEGKTLGEVWDPIPEAYLSMCPPKIPNYFIYQGPNGGPGAGSAIPFLENVAEYMIKCILKLQTQYIKSMVISDVANKSFSKHVDKYFEGTVFTERCRSWFKRGVEDGRVIALWPGSAIHAQSAFKSVRFEDFDYEYIDDENRMSWLGNGLTVAQEIGGPTTEYLDTVDIPPPLVEGVELSALNPVAGYVQMAKGENGIEQWGLVNGVSNVEIQLNEGISQMPT